MLHNITNAITTQVFTLPIEFCSNISTNKYYVDNSLQYSNYNHILQPYINEERFNKLVKHPLVISTLTLNDNIFYLLQNLTSSTSVNIFDPCLQLSYQKLNIYYCQNKLAPISYLFDGGAKELFSFIKRTYLPDRYVDNFYFQMIDNKYIQDLKNPLTYYKSNNRWYIYKKQYLLIN